jgi:hypothetical protein
MRTRSFTSHGFHSFLIKLFAMKKFSRFTLLLSCLISLLILPGCAREEATATSGIDPAQLKTAMNDGAAYLVRATKPTGEYVYLDNLQEGKTYKPVYNVLRHAGSMYALADYYSWKPDPKVKDALVSSARFLIEKYAKPIPGETDALAIWALPSDRAGDGPTEVKLGGIGLGLVGLIQTEKVAPGTTPLETLRKIGNAALWMQEPDGSFYSKYNPTQGGKDEKWNSLYYPGETALGLAMLAEIDPDPAHKKRWLNAAFRAVGYMAASRKGATNVPADHWILIATAQLWPHHAYSDQSISKADLIRHAVQICEVIVNDRMLRDVRSTPIATRVEGMNAALTFLPPEHKALREKLQTEIENGVRFLMKAQVKEGRMQGAVPRAYTPPGSIPVEPRADEVRIDYVQHALSAWLEYARQNGIIQKNETP